MSDRTEIIAQAKDLDPESYEWDSTDDLTVAINIIWGHGFSDDQAGSVEFGLHGARVGRYVLWTDDRGFQRLDTFDTESAAQEALDAEDARQNPEQD